MSYRGVIFRNSYFYETCDGNVYFEYASRDVKYEQTQNQATYNIFISMFNSDLVPGNMMT